MADVIVGGTMRWMLMFKMLEAWPAYTEYVERINAREPYRKAREVNDAVIKERGLGGGGG